MKDLIKFLACTIILSLFSCENDALIGPVESMENTMENTDHFAKSTSKLTVEIISPIEGLDITGYSTIHRNKTGITANFKANGLKPGYTYTLWWVIWNNPEACNTPYACNEVDFANAETVAVELLYAAGQVVGGDGVGNFSGRLNENDDSESVNALFGLPLHGGLLDVKKAEVHLVLRNHGPKISGEVNEQINSYTGGCDDPFAIAPFTEDADEVGECADIVFSIHPSPES